MSEDLKSVVKSLIENSHRQNMILYAMSSGLSSAIFLCMKSQKNCDGIDCEEKATWKKISDETHFCDRHISAEISKDESKYEDWEEVPDAEHIRNLTDFIKIRAGTTMN